MGAISSHDDDVVESRPSVTSSVSSIVSSQKIVRKSNPLTHTLFNAGKQVRILWMDSSEVFKQNAKIVQSLKEQLKEIKQKIIIHHISDPYEVWPILSKCPYTMWKIITSGAYRISPSLHKMFFPLHPNSKKKQENSPEIFWTIYRPEFGNSEYFHHVLYSPPLKISKNKWLGKSLPYFSLSHLSPFACHVSHAEVGKKT